MSAIDKFKLKKKIETDLKNLKSFFSACSFDIAADQHHPNLLFEKFLTNKNCIESRSERPTSIDLSPFILEQGTYYVRVHDHLSGIWFTINSFQDFKELCAQVPCMGLSLYSVDQAKLYSLYEDEHHWQYYIND